MGAYGIGYQDAIAYLRGMPFLSEEDKEWILGRELCEWLRMASEILKITA